MFHEGESEDAIVRRIGEDARAYFRELRERTRKEREDLHNMIISEDPPQIDPSKVPLILRTFSVWLIELEARIDKLAEESD